MNKKALLKLLNETFKPVEWKKGRTVEEWSCSTGEQKVIKFIEKLGVPDIFPPG